MKRIGKNVELGPGGVIIFIHVRFEAFPTKNKDKREETRNHSI